MEKQFFMHFELSFHRLKIRLTYCLHLLRLTCVPFKFCGVQWSFQWLSKAAVKISYLALHSKSSFHSVFLQFKWHAIGFERAIPWVSALWWYTEDIRQRGTLTQEPWAGSVKRHCPTVSLVIFFPRCWFTPTWIFVFCLFGFFLMFHACRFTTPLSLPQVFESEALDEECLTWACCKKEYAGV